LEHILTDIELMELMIFIRILNMNLLLALCTISGNSKHVHRDFNDVFEQYGFEACIKMNLTQLQDLRKDTLSEEKEQEVHHNAIFGEKIIKMLASCFNLKPKKTETRVFHHIEASL